MEAKKSPRRWKQRALNVATFSKSSQAPSKTNFSCFFFPFFSSGDQFLARLLRRSFVQFQLRLVSTLNNITEKQQISHENKENKFPDFLLYRFEYGKQGKQWCRVQGLGLESRKAEKQKCKNIWRVIKFVFECFEVNKC